MIRKKKIKRQEKNPYLKSNGSFDLIEKFPSYKKEKLKKTKKQINREVSKMENDKIELIFVKLICGGIGNAPRLYKYKNKYYHIRGDCDIEGQKKLLDFQYNSGIRHSQRKWFLWSRHSCDNVITASEFLRIIKLGV